MARYLITGGAGFIGSNLARRLVSLGEEVVILDDFSTGKVENLDDLTSSIEVIEGDICDIQTVRKATGGADYVLHHAAVVSVPKSMENPERTIEVNANGTLNCLKAARDGRVERFIFAASSSAYGESEELPKREDMVAKPLSPYGISKLVGEMYCKVFYDIYDLQTVCLRYFNIFGPYQDPTSRYAAVVPIFITCLLKGESPPVFGDGEQSRDFTYIDNAVDANLLAIKSDKSGGRVINVACDSSYTLNQLLGTLKRLTNSRVEPDYRDAREGDIRHSQGDISVAREILAYEPTVSFEEGLRRTVDWFKREYPA